MMKARRDFPFTDIGVRREVPTMCVNPMRKRCNDHRINATASILVTKPLLGLQRRLAGE